MRWNNNLDSSPLHQVTNSLAIRPTDEWMVDLGNGQTLNGQLFLNNTTTTIILVKEIIIITIIAIPPLLHKLHDWIPRVPNQGEFP